MAPHYSGRYRLDEAVGHDELGEVVTGADSGGREYTFRILRSQPDRPVLLTEDFRREQATLAGLGHANLVTLHDLVVEDGVVTLVLDRVSGGSLRRRMTASGTLLPVEIARIGAGAAQGLAALHGVEVSHGDVRPESVLLDESGVRVTDAGLWRLFPRPDPARMSLRTTSPYTAPEVAAGGEPTPASDMYSLGVLLYEAYCGVPPFPAGRVRKKNEEPGKPGEIPEPLWDLLRLLLAVRPDLRPDAEKTAIYLETMSADLRNHAAGRRLDRAPNPTTATPRQTPPVGYPSTMEVPLAAPPQGRKKKLIPVLAVLSVTALVVVLAVVLLSGEENTPTPPGANPTTPNSASPTQPPRTTTAKPAPTIAPALVGKKLAEAQDILGTEIEIESVDSVEQTAAPGTVVAQDPEAGAPLAGRIRLTVAQSPVEQYLAELNPVSGSSSDEESASLAGKSYPRSVTSSVSSCGNPGTVEYNISKGYRKLVANAGIDDNARSAELKLQLEIFGDGRKLSTSTLELGTPAPVDLDVSGVLRLKFTWSVVGKNDDCDYNTIVLGDAKVLGLPGEVPSVAPSSTR